jgi:hypothetical protein
MSSDPALLLKSQQRRVDGPLIEFEHFLTDLLDPARNAKPVERSKRLQGFQDHEVERALQDFRFLFTSDRSFGHCTEDSRSPMDCPMVNVNCARSSSGEAQGQAVIPSDVNARPCTMFNSAMNCEILHRSLLKGLRLALHMRLRFRQQLVARQRAQPFVSQLSGE